LRELQPLHWIDRLPESRFNALVLASFSELHDCARKNVALPTGSSAYAAIDTGTTLVGGPSSAIQNIFAQIPGSQPGTGSWAGYYSYPCSTEVNVAISFGGPSWSKNVYSVFSYNPAAVGFAQLSERLSR
ncbi:hypothetical protein EDD16DRAFT_1516966, partial [Pisolithus croceorrhizus]